MKIPFFIMIFFFASINIQSNAVMLSFDRLFPYSLQEKVLIAMMMIMYDLDDMYNSYDDGKQEKYHQIMNKLAIVKSYLKKINYKKYIMINDDVLYFLTIMEKIKQLTFKQKAHYTHRQLEHLLVMLQKIQDLIN